MVVLAPTGVAAINVQGQTIHSFFRFQPNITLEKVKKKNIKASKNIYKKIDAIVIDEVSMVRADLMDCVDRFMRLNGKDKRRPFGGTQMIFIGDLYQLPPVVVGKEREMFRSWYSSPYFFDAKVFENFEIELIELEKVYRQKDKRFINLLNSIRNNSAGLKELRAFNRRFDPIFESKPGEFFICLTTTNKLSDDINKKQLAKLKGKIFSNQAEINGGFEKKYYPTEVNLRLKKKTQIMFLNNDSEGRWVNGTIGKVVNFEEGNEDCYDLILVELEDGKRVEVEPHTWKVFKYDYNVKTKSLISERVGSFTQYPLRLAWSVTIHKSQGKTFDKVIIDIGRGTFAHGQMYVALSRCVSLKGIVLKKQLEKKHIFMDWRVVKFLTNYQYKVSDENCSLEDKIKIIKQVIKNKRKLDIVYLKSNDTKSKRIIEPSFIGDLEYLGKTFLGIEAFCLKRQEERVFRVDRILEMKEVG